MTPPDPTFVPLPDNGDALFELPESQSPTRQWLALAQTRGVEIVKSSETGQFSAEIESTSGGESFASPFVETESMAVDLLHGVLAVAGHKAPFPTFDAWRMDQQIKKGDTGR